MHADPDCDVLRRYEATVHNAWVRLLLDTGEVNVTGFADAWAENRFVEVEAPSLFEAMNILRRDYPPEAGFRIGAVFTLPDEAV